jgi:hypothetical protein
MAHLAKINKDITPIGGEHASEFQPFDGLYFLDFQVAGYGTTLFPMRLSALRPMDLRQQSNLQPTY